MWYLENKYFVPEVSEGPCISNTGCTRNEAEQICNRLDAKLAKMKKDGDLELAKLEMNKIEEEASFHIGLSNKASKMENLKSFSSLEILSILLFPLH